MVDADRRGGAAGVLLVRSLLSGDQEITWTDSGTPDVVRIWRMFGGDLDHARTCDWMLVLRPRRWARRIAGDGARRLAGIAASPGGWAGRDVAPIRAFPFPARRQLAEGGAADDKIESAQVSIADLASELGDMAREIRVLVDHDEPYLSYLFSYLEDTLSLQNEIVRNSVRRNGRVIGWYAYLVRPAVSRVIHIGASAREAEHVTAALLEDARSRGTEVLSGRLEPHLDAPLRNRGALLALSQQPLVHSNNADLRAAWGSSASLITEIDLIDSEWW